MPDGLVRLRAFPDGQVLDGPPEKPTVFTAELLGFHPREEDGERTWRWMTHESFWRVVNATSGSVRALLEVELTLFPGGRRLEATLDHRSVASLTLPDGPRRCRIGLWC